MRVCLICEGCYPYVPGGVSSWIQTLCSAYKDVEFVIWALATTREEMYEYSYDIPENVKEIRTIYLGDEEFRKTHHKVVLSREERAVLKNLVIASVEEIDWVGILELIRKYRKYLGDILLSESFFEICLE